MERTAWASERILAWNGQSALPETHRNSLKCNAIVDSVLGTGYEPARPAGLSPPDEFFSQLIKEVEHFATRTVISPAYRIGGLCIAKPEFELVSVSLL